MDLPARLRPFYEPGSPTRELGERLAAEGYRALPRRRDGARRVPRPGPHGPDVDVDITTDARPDAVERIVARLGRPRLAPGPALRHDRLPEGGATLEITTFRAEVYRPESRKPEVAVRRRHRDRPVAARLHGQRDGARACPSRSSSTRSAARPTSRPSVLRTPLAPEVSFVDDPLRMLRAARFIAQLRARARARARRARSSELRPPARDRQRRADPRRALASCSLVDDPTAGLWFLCETGLSDEFLPELNAMRLEQDPIHTHKDVLAHTIAVVRKTRPELRVRLAALFHDVGKPKTRSFATGRRELPPPRGGRRPHDRGAAAARCKYPNDVVDDVTQLVYLHLRIHTYAMGWTDKAVRRYVRDAGAAARPAQRAPALRLHDAQQAQGARRSSAGWTSSRRASPSCASRRSSTRSGRRSTAARSWRSSASRPGRVIGEALDFLLEARLDEGPIDEAEAYDRLDRLGPGARHRARRA